MLACCHGGSFIIADQMAGGEQDRIDFSGYVLPLGVGGGVALRMDTQGGKDEGLGWQ